MPRCDVTLESNIERTARVMQVEGMFDMNVADKTRVEYHFDVPIEAQEWSIGLIVGPSGAGKSTVARKLFSAELVDTYEWHENKAIVDCFDVSARDATNALSSVGFSSPPSWLKPFHVLSNGEKFRANLARSLVDGRKLIVFDEFSSVVDRQAALVGCHALQKQIRKQESRRRFVAVTCHYDVLEWLQPDWVLEPHLGRFVWRSLRRRPSKTLSIFRARRDSWRLFAEHHYLSTSLPNAARCFVGFVDDEPAAFGALVHFPHPKAKNINTVSRSVVLPSFQGLGLGAHLMRMLGHIGVSNDKRVRATAAHPAMTSCLARSNVWRIDRSGWVGAVSERGRMNSNQNRRTSSFEFCGGAFADIVDLTRAQKMWNAHAL